MTYHHRPSDREIDKRLKEARNALQKGCVLFANDAKAVGELINLEIDDSAEVWDLITILLDEVTLTDYAGGHPPLPCSEQTTLGCQLWAFAWNSNHLKKNMYLKFVLKNDHFYYVSLHESRFPRT